MTPSHSISGRSLVLLILCGFCLGGCSDEPLETVEWVPEGEEQLITNFPVMMHDQLLIVRGAYVRLDRESIADVKIHEMGKVANRHFAVVSFRNDGSPQNTEMKVKITYGVAVSKTQKGLDVWTYKVDDVELL